MLAGYQAVPILESGVNSQTWGRIPDGCCGPHNPEAGPFTIGSGVRPLGHSKEHAAMRRNTQSRLVSIAIRPGEMGPLALLGNEYIPKSSNSFPAAGSRRLKSQSPRGGFGGLFPSRQPLGINSRLWEFIRVHGGHAESSLVPLSGGKHSASTGDSTSTR